MRDDRYDMTPKPGSMMVVTLDERALAVLMLTAMAGRPPPAGWTTEQVLDDAHQVSPELMEMVRACSVVAVDYFTARMGAAAPEPLQ